MITAIVNGNILDTTSMTVVGEGDLVVENGQFVQVGGRHSGKADTTVDARGAFVMPGLIDGHVHFRLATMNFARLERWTEVEFGIVMAGLAADTVHRGFTTVRDLGGDVSGLVRAIADGRTHGPRIVRAGLMLSQTGGHGDTRGGALDAPSCACAMPNTIFGLVADGPDAVRKGARHILRDGSDFLKVHVSGGVASPSDPVDAIQYTHDEIRAAVVEAEHRHTYVAAHAYSAESITMAAHAGVKSFEHANNIDHVAAELLAEKDATMVPTLVTYLAMDEMGEKLGLPEQNRRKNKVILESGLRSVEIALQAGVALGFGTDLIGETQQMQNRELAIRGSIQPAAEVLRSMWIENARLCRLEGRIGVLTEGAVGDVVVSNVNPLDDLTRFADHQNSITHVVQGGRVVRG